MHSGSATFPHDKDLRLYYMAFRFFYLNDEPTNILRVRNLFSQISNNSKYISLMKKIKSQWKDALGNHFLSDFYGREILGKELLDLWFNAHYFHSDFGKEEDLVKMNQFLSNDISRFFLFTTVITACTAINTLNRSTSELTKNGGDVYIPLWLIDEVGEHL